MEHQTSGLTERQKEILGQLEHVFLEEGYQALTVADLADQLKCSKRSLYEIAPSKQELFLVVVEGWLHRIREMGLKASFRQQNASDRIRSYLAPGVTETNRASERFLRDLVAYRAARNALDMHQHERSIVLQNIIEGGIETGIFRPVNPALVAEMFIICVGQLSNMELLNRAGLSFSAAMSGVFDLILQGVEKS